MDSCDEPSIGVTEGFNSMSEVKTRKQDAPFFRSSPTKTANTLNDRLNSMDLNKMNPQLPPQCHGPGYVLGAQEVDRDRECG